MFKLIEVYRAKLNLEIALSKLDFLIDEMGQDRSSVKDFVFWNELIEELDNPYLNQVKYIEHIRKSYKIHFKVFINRYCSEINKNFYLANNL